MSAVGWALVAALGFGVGQLLNRKSNQIVGAFLTTFGLLVFVEAILIIRAVVTGEIGELVEAPIGSLAAFATATVIHYGGGWTCLALSQVRIGVARTGALVSSAPLVASVLAALVLDEPLTVATVVGVIAAAGGVALISLSGVSPEGRRWAWARPWFALTVAVLWGSSPMLIRIGLEGFDRPVLGLTAGLGVSVVVYAIGLTVAGAWRRGAVPVRAAGWMLAGGVVGAVAISAQWISFGLTTVAVAITVQNLSTLVVVALVPIVFHEPFERLNPIFLIGTVAMLGGTALVVAAGA